MSTFYNDFLPFLQARLSSYIEERRLLSVLPPHSPAVRALEELISPCEEMMKRRGLKTQRLADNILYGALPGASSSSLLWYMHLDTHTLNKGALDTWLTCLATLDFYEQTGMPRLTTLKWLVNFGDEGTDDLLTRIVHAHHDCLQADGCLWFSQSLQGTNGLPPYPLPTLALGAKGTLQVALSVDTSSEPGAQSISAMYGTIAPNAAWRLAWALASLKNAQEEVLLEGFYDTQVAKDDEALALLHLLPDATESWLQHYAIPDPLLGLHGFQLRYAQLLLPTCVLTALRSNIAILRDGSAVSLPTQAEAQLLFYLVPDQDPDELFQVLRRHLDERGFVDVHTQILNKSWPVSIPSSSAFARLVVRSMSTAYEGKPHLLPLTMESYPLSALAHLSMPIMLADIGLASHDIITTAECSEAFASGVRALLMILRGVAETLKR